MTRGVIALDLDVAHDRCMNTDTSTRNSTSHTDTDTPTGHTEVIDTYLSAYGEPDPARRRPCEKVAQDVVRSSCAAHQHLRLQEANKHPECRPTGLSLRPLIRPCRR